jgi:hypothetical protein
MKNLNNLFLSLIILGAIVPFRSFASEDSIFLQRVRKFLKLSAGLGDNQGVSVGLSGSAFVVGTGISADAINFDGKVSFFCSSSFSLKAENGADFTKDFNYISVRGCGKKAEMYEGLFMTLSGSGGVDFVAKGAVGGAVSYGLNKDIFISTLGEYFVKKPENLKVLLKEMANLVFCLHDDTTSQLLRFYIQAILKYLQVLVYKANDSVQRNEILVQIQNIQNVLDGKVFSLTCGFENVSENLKKNSVKFFEYSKSEAYRYKLASLLPSKDKLALVVRSTLDSDQFPLLSSLLLEILGNGMSGCDSVTAGLSVGFGVGSGATVSVGLSASNSKKIGPTFDLRELRESVIDRYVQKNGLNNFLGDSKEAYARVCTAAGQCMWKASCMMTEREAFTLGIDKVYSACTQVAKNTVAFLNSMYECYKDNYKELTVRPYETLSKVGK